MDRGALQAIVYRVGQRVGHEWVTKSLSLLELKKKKKTGEKKVLQYQGIQAFVVKCQRAMSEIIC